MYTIMANPGKAMHTRPVYRTALGCMLHQPPHRTPAIPAESFFELLWSIITIWWDLGPDRFAFYIMLTWLSGQTYDEPVHRLVVSFHQLPPPTVPFLWVAGVWERQKDFYRHTELDILSTSWGRCAPGRGPMGSVRPSHIPRKWLPCRDQLHDCCLSDGVSLNKQTRKEKQKQKQTPCRIYWVPKVIAEKGTKEIFSFWVSFFFFLMANISQLVVVPQIDEI